MKHGRVKRGQGELVTQAGDGLLPPTLSHLRRSVRCFLGPSLWDAGSEGETCPHCLLSTVDQSCARVY